MVETAREKTQDVDLQSPSSRTLLCVMMPALNEEATVGEVIARVPRHLPGISEITVVVVDDGSTDDTRRIALEAGAIVVSHTSNLGVGRAFQTGVEKALELGADYLVNVDSDGQFDPDDISKLLEPLLEGRADGTTASRFIDRSLTPVMKPVNYYGNLAMALIVSALVGRRFHDVTCGFRAYTRDTLLRLNLHADFTYTQETLLDLTFKGLNVEEVPIVVKGTREVGESRVGKRITLYMWNVTKIMFRTFRDYYPLRVFGVLAAFFLIAALGLFGFLLAHYLATGSFSPHKWAGFTGGFLATVGGMCFVTGLLADMVRRIRTDQERILYLLRKRGE